MLRTRPTSVVGHGRHPAAFDGPNRSVLTSQTLRDSRELPGGMGPPLRAGPYASEAMLSSYAGLMAHGPPWVRATFVTAFDGFARHRLPRLAAALAYYTLFSLAPLLIIALVIARAVLRDNAVESDLFSQLADVVGESLAATIESLVTVGDGLSGGQGLAASVVGGLILFIGASGMFQQIQDALNTVWDIPISEVRGLLRSLQRRLYGVISVFIIGILLSLFVVGGTIVAVLAGDIVDRLGGLGVLLGAVNPLIAFLGVSVVSALVFQWLPARSVPWRAAWAGGVLTTGLLLIGSGLIGLLFAYANPGASFGQFAAIIVLLVYLYYTAQIFLFGAELTAAYVKVRMPEEAESG